MCVCVTVCAHASVHGGGGGGGRRGGEEEGGMDRKREQVFSLHIKLAITAKSHFLTNLQKISPSKDSALFMSLTLMQPTSAPAPITSQPPPPSSVITSSGPRPVFPAYQQQPPSGNPAGVDGRPSAMVPTLPEVSRRPAEKVPSVGPGCKLIHPEDDLSLVSSCC